MTYLFGGAAANVPGVGCTARGEPREETQLTLSCKVRARKMGGAAHAAWLKGWARAGTG